MCNKTQRLKEELDDAVKKGVLIYQDGRRSTPEEIVYQQWMHEESAYLPEFIVKDEMGEVKEIWYGETKPLILTD